MSRALDSLSAAERAKLKRASPPRGLEPMKARLTDERFSDPDWIFERKLDGERCLAYRTPRGVHLPSRTRWVEPRLVGQFAFSEWTRDGRLRHPRYLALHDDKHPSEVVRERRS